MASSRSCPFQAKRLACFNGAHRGVSRRIGKKGRLAEQRARSKVGEQLFALSPGFHRDPHTARADQAAPACGLPLSNNDRAGLDGQALKPCGK